VNFFRNDFTNLIDTQIIARQFNGQNVFSYRNFDEVYTTGLELDASYQFTKNLSLSGGYQLLYAYDKTQLEKIDNDEVFTVREGRTVLLERSDYFGLVNRSRHTANFTIFYKIPTLNIDTNFRLVYRSKYGLFDTNGNGLLDTDDTSFVDGFATANVAATKKFGDHFELQIGANNLFNYTDIDIPNINGIQLYTTLNYNF
jgi:outer membrane receptor for ferrienterochelin and colicins